MALTANERKAVTAYAKAYLAAPKGRAIVDRADWKRVERVFNAIMAASRDKSAPAERRELSVDLTLISPRQIRGADFEITAWGPTTDDVTDARLKFIGRGKGAPLKDDLPNQVSGALLIRWGKSRVLLGGDLFAHEHNHRAWGPARALAQSASPIQVVNVAHHASHNAHDATLWKAMKPSLAIVTPFNYATTRINKKTILLEPWQPLTPSDVRRLLKRGCEVAITSTPRWHDQLLKPSTPKKRGKVTSANRSVVSGASPLLNAAAGSDPSDADNAVAVELNASGEILNVLLAGEGAF